MVEQLDEDDPLWGVNEQIKGLLEGFGASEDHEDVLKFLRATGLPEDTVKRMHRAIVHGDSKVLRGESSLTFDQWYEREGRLMTAGGCDHETVAKATWFVATTAGRSSATDRDRLKELLTDFGVEFEGSDRTTGRTSDSEKVDGYMGFFTLFKFDENGNFVKMGAFE